MHFIRQSIPMLLYESIFTELQCQIWQDSPNQKHRKATQGGTLSFGSVFIYFIFPCFKKIV